MAMIRPEIEMKDSGDVYIGKMPLNWRLASYKYFADSGMGLTILKEDVTDLGVPIYSATQDSSIFGYINNPKLKLNKGDLVIPARGNSIGCTTYVEDDVATCTQTTIYSKVSGINPKFLFYCSIGLKEEWFYYVKTAIPQITVSQVQNNKVPLPPLSEQQAIADYLDETCSKIDEIIAKAKASIDEYKELKQSVIFEAVTKGLDKNVEMKDSGYDFIGCIPSEWEMCKVRHLGTAQNGISIGGNAFGSGHPFVSYGDVYKNYSLPKVVDKLVQSSEEDRKRYSVEKGDWFFTRTSETIEEVGFSCVCEETIPDAVFAGFLIRVRPFNNRIYTGFAKYYFRSNHLRTFFVKEMNLVTRASLTQGLLKDAPVVVPPYDEQIEIANYLENKCEIIDGVIKDKESTINDLEAYKKSLIYEVVTGKRRVV